MTDEEYTAMLAISDSIMCRVSRGKVNGILSFDPHSGKVVVYSHTAVEQRVYDAVIDAIRDGWRAV